MSEVHANSKSCPLGPRAGAIAYKKHSCSVGVKATVWKNTAKASENCIIQQIFSGWHCVSYSLPMWEIHGNPVSLLVTAENYGSISDDIAGQLLISTDFGMEFPIASEIRTSTNKQGHMGNL